MKEVVVDQAVEWHSRIAKCFDRKYLHSPAFIQRRIVWENLITRYIEPGATVLDAGCGPGVIARVAAGRAASVLGIDASPEMVALATSRAAQFGLSNTTFRLAAIEDSTAFGDVTFDAVLCSSVLEYVADYWSILGAFARVTKPKGILVFSMPNASSLHRQAERLLFRATGRPAYYAHVRHLSNPAALAPGLAALDFEIVETHYYGGLRAAARLASGLGRPELIETLFVMVCRKRG